MYARRFAVVVGVRNYSGGLTLVDNAANDAFRMHAVMSERYGFESRLLSDMSPQGVWAAASAVPTNSAILDAIGDAHSHIGADDLFVFYYAGHGDRRGYLLPSGANRSNPATVLNYAHLFGRLSALSCRHVIAILDCCYAAGAVRGATHAAFEVLPTSRDRDRAMAILYSTTEDGLAPDSFMSGSTQSLNSPFTQALASVIENGLGAWTIQDLLQAIRQGLPPDTRLEPGVEVIGHGRPRWPEPPIVVRSLRSNHRWVSINPLEFHIGHAEHEIRRYWLSLLAGSDAEWVLERPSRAVSLKAGGELTVRPGLLDVGSNDVAVQAVSARGERIASATLRFHRQTEARLRISSEALEPCFVGQPYRCRVHAEGGLAPYDWDAEGLPRGLSIERSLGWIVGRIDRAAYDAGRVAALVRLTVRDSAGGVAIRVVRLAAVPLDEYREVPAGPCAIGPTAASEVSAELRCRFPSARVNVPRFFIRKYPITEREWNHAHGRDGGGLLPATGMTYAQAEEFCRKRGSRLPNRFEWEKAARGEDGLEYPWGSTFDPDRLNGPALWWGDRTRVDQFPEGASPYGVMDLCGNVQELVRDRSLGADNAILQRVRGGSFRSSQVEFSAWAAFELAPTSDGGPAIGFRDVIEVHDAPLLPQGFVRVRAGKLRGADGTWERWPQFDIARYAVSNAEYEEFVDETRSPRPSHWPFAFEDRYLPVVNVDVDAVKKFCEWKTERLERRVRPLTRSVWRAAALVSQGGVRRFPWGDEYVPHWCNGRDSGWGGPVRVFEIADGRAPCGAFNLAGNVYEWCGNNQVIGGSWRSSCTDPDSVKPANGPRDDIGFRYWAEMHSEQRR